MVADDPLIHAIGWFDGRYVYNVHTRGLFDALSRRLPVLASPIRDRQGPVAEDKAAIRRLFQHRRRVTVTLLYGGMARVMYDVDGARVGYTVWESTRLPPDWVENLDRYCDRIWAVSAWGKRVFAANGLAPDRIDVVPEGVDPALFNPSAPPTDGLDRSPAFTFLAIGRWEKRKGIPDLVRAFDAEFGERDDVRLVLAGLHANQPGLDLRAALRALRLRWPERLKIVGTLTHHRLLAGLYTACDAFVAPTRAEGWGLPVIEAMACGLPTIVTGYSGVTEFIGEHAWRIDHRLVPIDEPYFEAPDGDHGQWAEPDWHHLRHLLRALTQNRDAARTRGLAGSEWVRTRFSWDRAAAVAELRLREIADRMYDTRSADTAGV
ncbi:MAG: glycosyltransferase family 4 protein [Alphaproteobacteria bacterium]|nr:glycosyltransferase family 4 protein [Alphaproteobacteria bacterium]